MLLSTESAFRQAPRFPLALENMEIRKMRKVFPVSKKSRNLKCYQNVRKFKVSQLKVRQNQKICKTGMKNIFCMKFYAYFSSKLTSH